MAVYVFTDGLLFVNGIEFSDHTKSITLRYEAELLDDTVMGCTTRSNLPGLLNWNLECEMLQDFAAGSIDATLFSLVGAAAFPVRTRRSKTDAIGATNPEYQGNGVLEGYTPLGGGVGDLGSTTITIRPGGRTTATLVRDVTP